MRTVILTIVVSTDDRNNKVMRTNTIVTGTSSQDNVTEDLALAAKTMNKQLLKDKHLQPVTVMLKD